MDEQRDKCTKEQKKKTDERMEESVMEDALLRVPVGMGGGHRHWPYKFMIWKTGNRRHAVMDGMMAI